VTAIIQPDCAQGVADALRRASDARQPIVIRGAGTKRDWGRPSSGAEAVLDMRRMNRILAHEHGDMTATIEAGASLHDVNTALAVHGQTLPLDPPFAESATIGGLLATNDSGPLRHRYGTPRDLVIGVELATTDGVISKAGGRVVKNVAGYDLSKLIAGSFGSLAAIVSATFKLSPLPAGSKTMCIGVGDREALAGIVQTVMSSQLEPIAFDVAFGTRSPHNHLFSAAVAGSAFDIYIRFASLPAVVDAQIAQATAALGANATSIDVVDGDAERALWDRHAAGICSAPGAIVRASWLPANIEAVVAALKPCDTSDGSPAAHGKTSPAAQGETSPVAHGFSRALIGRAAIGAGLIRIGGDTASQARAIEQLRASKVFGNVVIVRGSSELKAVVDVWGSHGDRQPLLESLKRAFDPNGVLNAGRGPL